MDSALDRQARAVLDAKLATLAAEEATIQRDDDLTPQQRRAALVPIEAARHELFRLSRDFGW